MRLSEISSASGWALLSTISRGGASALAGTGWQKKAIFA
jgi:hypothetical protein